MRDDLKIRVIIEGRFGRVIAEAVAPVQSHMTEVFTPLKMSDGDWAFPLFDTEPAVIRRVTVMRDDYAKYLAPEITKALISAMRSKDTINGYTRAEREEMGKAPKS